MDRLAIIELQCWGFPGVTKKQLKVRKSTIVTAQNYAFSTSEKL